MEQNLSDTERQRYKIEPPGDAAFSTLLNNIGNGAMLGAVPVLLLKFWEEMTNKKIGIKFLSEGNHGKLGMGMAVVGCSIGAVMGVREARRLQDYRHAVSNEVAELHAKLDEHSAAIAKWSEKENNRKQHAREDVGQTIA